MIANWRRLVTSLGLGITILLIALVLWFGHDLWATFTRGWNEGLAPAEFNVRQARALEDAKVRRMQGPETVIVYVPKEIVKIRERHGVAIPVPSTTTPAEVVGGVMEDETPVRTEPYLLDMKDLFAEKCGDTYEVGCWLYPDGHGVVTIVERPRTIVEKGVDAVTGGLSALHGWPHTLEVGAELDLERTSDWRAWAAYEPVRIGHIRPRVKVQEESVDGVRATKVYGGIVARFDLNRR